MMKVAQVRDLKTALDVNSHKAFLIRYYKLNEERPEICVVWSNS